MTESTSRDHAPSDSLLDGAVQDINNTLEWISTQLETLSPAELIQFREGPFAATKRMFGQVDAELVRVFSNHGEDVVHDGYVHYAARSKSAEKWDGPALASLCAARATDWVFDLDRETGEMKPVPPVVLATRIVTATAKALGGFAASTSWRVKALEDEFGISKDEVARHRSSEPGNPVISKRPVKASDTEREAA